MYDIGCNRVVHTLWYSQYSIQKQHPLSVLRWCYSEPVYTKKCDTKPGKSGGSRKIKKWSWTAINSILVFIRLYPSVISFKKMSGRCKALLTQFTLRGSRLPTFAPQVRILGWAYAHESYLYPWKLFWCFLIHCYSWRTPLQHHDKILSIAD